MKSEKVIDGVFENFYDKIVNKAEKEKADTDTEILTREYLEEVLRAHLAEGGYAYRSGEKLSFEDWKDSAAAVSDRAQLDRDIGDAQRSYYDARARAIRSKIGQGSGYGAYAASERKQAYERAMQDASAALAESYGEFYDELESGESGASFDQRLSTISYIASNRMNEREGLLYALAAGLSYEEASEIARGAYLLGALLDERFEDYVSGLEGEKNKN